MEAKSDWFGFFGSYEGNGRGNEESLESGSLGSEERGFGEERDSRSDAVGQCHHCKTLIFASFSQRVQFCFLFLE